MDRSTFFQKKTGIAICGAMVFEMGCEKKHPNNLITIGMIGTGFHGTEWNLKY